MPTTSTTIVILKLICYAHNTFIMMNMTLITEYLCTTGYMDDEPTSLHVAFNIMVVPGRPANSDSTLPRSSHLVGVLIGCHKCITWHSGNAPTSPDLRPALLSLSRMYPIHHLHPCLYLCTYIYYDIILYTYAYFGNT